VYGYISDDTNLFTSKDGSSVVCRASFSDKVEILEKSGKAVLYKGNDGEWFLVRKSTGDEGWIHSSLLLKQKPSKRKQSKDESSDSFNVPVSGTRTSNFGSRVDPVTHKQNSFHSGIDIAAAKGTPVSAAQAGKVSRAEFNKNGYGNLIVLEHQKDFTTYYGHLSSIKVTVGQSVKKGDNIGAVGSTGKSTGPHLHFEVRRGDTALDPDSFLK
jgi:murein DD-endopeptidase MepM/ murein hydrolase activator NlpD